MNSRMSEKRSITESQNAAELAQQAGLERDLAVDEVEDVGDDHDEPGPDEVPAGERGGGPDVDQAADERQDVRVDSEATHRR